MKRWQVELTAMACATVEVEAETAYEACEEAYDAYRRPGSVRRSDISICSEWSLSEYESPVEIKE